ncbi:MAG: excalibur calcium-binding domain-containing protein [Gammaproteobacteria bacterium]
MKRILFLAVVLLVTWSVFQKPSSRTCPDDPSRLDEYAPSVDAGPKAQDTRPQFRCDGRHYCIQIHSRAEAIFFTRNCPDTKIDSDQDGIPCEHDSRF